MFTKNKRRREVRLGSGELDINLQTPKRKSQRLVELQATTGATNVASNNLFLDFKNGEDQAVMNGSKRSCISCREYYCYKLQLTRLDQMVFSQLIRRLSLKSCTSYCRDLMNLMKECMYVYVYVYICVVIAFY